MNTLTDATLSCARRAMQSICRAALELSSRREPGAQVQNYL
jgi:hypothetical protein